MNNGLIWCIGAIDSSGGAGLQADIKAASAFEVHAASVTTAITVQSHKHFAKLEPVTPHMLQQTLHILRAEQLPAAIKIGAVINDRQAQVISDELRSLKTQVPELCIVWDPVLSSSSGGKLSQLSPVAIQQLLSVSDLVTPNVEELSTLTGQAIVDNKSMSQASESLNKTGASRVLTKAGHANWQSQPTDLLVGNGTPQWLRNCHKYQHSVRGSGCTLATAIASVCALDYPIEDAICVAYAYVQQQWSKTLLLQQGIHVFNGGNWPSEQHFFPVLLDAPDHEFELEAPFPAMEVTDLGLYPVVDSAQWIERLLPTGINIIQLRIKSGTDSLLRDEINKAVALCQGTGCQLFINDHWQLAIEAGAYGVHLGQEDLATADLNCIQRAGLRLGISTHGFHEICRARACRPSYIALGHIFPTKTKSMPSSPQGLQRLSRYAELLQDTPTIAIGGISLARSAQVKACGVDGVAVVTAITEAQDPIATAKALQTEVQHAG